MEIDILKIAFNDHKEAGQLSTDSYESQILQLQTDLVNIQKSHSNELEAVKNKIQQSQHNDGNQRSQIEQLQSQLQNYQDTLSSLREERQKTIEAHQSRISQLQSKYLTDITDLKTKNSEEVSKIELKIREQLKKENEIEIDSMKKKITQVNSFIKILQECQLKLDNLNNELNSVKTLAANETKKAFESASKKYSEKIIELERMIASLISSKKSDDEIYQQEISNLKNKILQQSSNEKYVPKNTSQLSALLAQRESEIAFLKDTVRIECEERMGLVSTLHNLKQNITLRSNSTPPEKTPGKIFSDDPNDMKKCNKAASQLSSKEQALHALFQAAVLKKEKKLQRQRRS